MNYSTLTSAINTNIEKNNSIRRENKRYSMVSSLKTELQVKQMCNKIVKHISTLNIVDAQIIEDKIVLFYSTGYSTGSINLGMEYYDLIFPTKESTLINDAEYDLIKNLGKNAKVELFGLGGLYIKVNKGTMYIYSLNKGHVLQSAQIATNHANIEYYVADFKNFSRNLDNTEVIPNWTKSIDDVMSKECQYIEFDTKELLNAIKFIKGATYQDKLTFRNSKLTSANEVRKDLSEVNLIGISDAQIEFKANYKYLLSCIDKNQPTTKIGVSNTQLHLNNAVVMQMN